MVWWAVAPSYLRSQVQDKTSIQPDLFGGATLVREWGRIGAGGQMMIEPHADEGQAITALMTLVRVKKRRGYA